MMLALELIARLALWLLLAPLVPGIINRVKAWVAGRRGPPVLQLYYDLGRLWRKGVVLSTTVSPGFVAAPAVAWVALAGAALAYGSRRAMAGRVGTVGWVRWGGHGGVGTVL